MKRIISWIDNASDRVFSRMKWTLSALSGVLTTLLLWSLLTRV